MVGAAPAGVLVGACVGDSVTGDREGLDVSPCEGLCAFSSSNVSSAGG